MACMGHLFISLCMLGKHIYLVCSRQVVYYQVQVEKERTLHCFILLTQLHLMLFFSLSLTHMLCLCKRVSEREHIAPMHENFSMGTRASFFYSATLHSTTIISSLYLSYFSYKKAKNIILSIKILLLFFSFILELFHTIHLVFQS